MSDRLNKSRAKIALQHISEELCQTLFEQTTDGIFIADQQGHYIEVNSRGCEMLGYTYEELLKLSWQDIIPAEDQGHNPLWLEELRAGKSVLKGRRLRGKDGALLSVEISTRLLSDGNLLAVVRNISVYQQVEAAFQRGHQNCVTVVNSINGIIWEADAHTFQFTFVSQQAERLLGYPLQRWLTEPTFWSDHLHPDDQTWVVNFWVKSVREKRSYELEYRMVAADGRVVWLQNIVTVIRENDHPVRLRGLIVDITERRRTEEERLAHLRYLESMDQDLRFFECMDQVNRAIQGTNDQEQMMSNVLDMLLSIFDCDRAWLIYPCDPEAVSWRVSMERTRPEYPGAFALGVEVVMNPEVVSVARTLRDANGPVKFGPGGEYQVPPELRQRFGIQSFIAMTLHPKVGQPWMFGLHQCSYPRGWIPEDQRLFQEIGRRLTDGLTGLVAYHNLQQSERRYREVFENVSDNILLIDMTENGRLLYAGANPAGEMAMGIAAAKMRAKPIEEVLPEPIATNLTIQCRRCLESGAPVEYDMSFSGSDGQRYIHAMLIPVRNTVGRIYRFIGITNDLTAGKQVKELRHKREQEFRALVENSPDFIARYDQAGDLVYVNPAVERSFGIPAQEILGQHLAEVSPIGSKWGLTIRDKVNEVLESSAWLEAEITWDGLPAGHLVYHHFRFVPECNQNGQVVGVLAIGRDITALKESQRMLTKLAESFPGVMGTYLLRPDGTFAMPYTSPHIIDIYGVRPEDVVYDATPANSRVYPEDINQLTESFTASAKNLTPWHDEFRVQHPDKGLIWVEGRSTPELQPDGGIIWFGFIHDITERKQAEEALRESEAKFLTAFRYSPSALSVTSMKRQIFLNANERFLQSTGYTRQEVVGHTSTELNLWAKPEQKQQFWWSMQRHGEVQEFELSYQCKDGEVRYALASATLIMLSGETCILTQSNDITERKQAEKARAKLEERLRQAQKLESIGRLAGGVAHDFNNLLTVIQGYTVLMQQHLLAEDPLIEMVAQVRQASEHATTLTRQLLAFSRQQILAPTVLDLNDLVEKLHKMLKRLIGEDITLSLALQPGLRPITADPGHIEQVIMNLVVNARDAMPTGGRITIETANIHLDHKYAQTHPNPPINSCVMLAVTDTGHGMDKSTQAHIFEPFFTTKESSQGTGLGLATVYGIVKQSGGNIQVYSEPGLGTTFKIYLPASPTPIKGIAAPQPQLATQGGGETILLVEDEEAVRRLMRVGLHRKGYTVLEAGSGHEGLALAQQYEDLIGLLITDVVMPHMNGRELAEQIKSIQPQIKVLFTSGYAADAVVRHGILTSEIEFLSKPFSPSELVNKVRQILDN